MNFEAVFKMPTIITTFVNHNIVFVFYKQQAVSRQGNKLMK